MTVTCLHPSASSTTPRMGRRKQHCPQKTGLTGENNGSSNVNNDENGPNSAETGSTNPQNDDRNASESSESEKETVTMPTLESLEPDPGSNGIRTPSTSSASKSLNREEALANMLKNPLLNLNPALLNPSLYAVQFAQLQAALTQSAGLQQLAVAAVSSSNSPPKRPSLAEDMDEGPSKVRKRKIQEQEDELSALNLSKRSPTSSPKLTERTRGSVETPLDLSGSKAGAGFPAMSPAKAPKLDLMQPWANAFPFLNPFLNQEALTRFPAAAAAAAAAAATRMSPASSPPAMTVSSTPTISSSAASSLDKNPLERMSEIAKTGGHPGAGRSSMGGPRHSAWQSQWINRGPEATKDIFKCVWCKDSFSTLQALTTHMKETKHFGSSISPSPQGPGRPSMQNTPSSNKPTPPLAPVTPPTTSPSSKPRDLLKEQLPMPRKLVRGQDVWLGRGEQQTKDILKCMWCGESFRSLDLMTKHMQETKHYTKVISQEQLVSWKATDTQASPQNHVNAVLTCKVCEQPFSSLKDLSDHMVKNNHYKSPSEARGATATATATSSAASLAAVAASVSGTNTALARSLAGISPGGPTGIGQPPPPKEKRKKSLPVRKLLELERAQQELSGHIKANNEESPGKISCDKCGEKILMHLFVDHIRRCVGQLSLPQSSDRTRSPSVSPPRAEVRPPSVTRKDLSQSDAKEEPKSILGSLEKMVQNNFGSKRKPGPESNMSILQRLGIDEGVDYSKPLLDPMAMFRPSAMSGLSPGLAGLFSGSQKNSETRSNSECSSPDRFKLDRPASIKSETSVKSPSSFENNIKSSPSHTPDYKQKLEANVEVDVEKTASESTSKPASIKTEGEDDVAIKEEDKEMKDEDAAAHKNSKSPLPRSVSPKPTSSPNHSLKSEEEEVKEDPDADDDDKKTPSPGPQSNGEGKKSGKKKSHPLAALQLLCDKTEKTPKPPVTTSSNLYGSPTDPGAILAFSWACNQAVINDSLLKCPFCDTPFISKGAYRHHLSKMHFVKDGASPDPKMLMSSGSGSGSRTPENSPTPTSMSGEAKEENAQSKFAKYSQLAKQLSCSSQP